MIDAEKPLNDYDKHLRVLKAHVASEKKFESGRLLGEHYSWLSYEQRVQLYEWVVWHRKHARIRPRNVRRDFDHIEMLHRLMYPQPIPADVVVQALYMTAGPPSWMG